MLASGGLYFYLLFYTWQRMLCSDIDGNTFLSIHHEIASLMCISNMLNTGVLQFFEKLKKKKKLSLLGSLISFPYTNDANSKLFKDKSLPWTVFTEIWTTDLLGQHR